MDILSFTIVCIWKEENYHGYIVWLHLLTHHSDIISSMTCWCLFARFYNTSSISFFIFKELQSWRMVSSGMLCCVALVTSQKTPLFIVTAVKTSNLTHLQSYFNKLFFLTLYFTTFGAHNSVPCSWLRCYATSQKVVDLNPDKICF
jgi:hypothetical protein